MNSIQKRLTIIVLRTTLALLTIAGGSLFIYVRFALLHQLDRSMESQGRVLCSAVRSHLDGRVTLEAAESAVGARRGARPPRDFFQICTADGKTLFRSASLGNSDITHDLPNTPPFGFDITLPDGRSARLHRLKFTPRQDDDDPVLSAMASTVPSIAAQTPLVLFLAHDREEIDETLWTILTSLFITALLLSAAIFIGIPYAVRRGLLPLRQIATAVDRIKFDALDNHVSLDQMPAELAPICNRLNDLMTRLHDAFQRERRFSSDVAHELRTPIAELRTMAEVALRWPPDAAAAARNFRETFEVAKQMEAVVTTLLTISRCEAGAEAIRISTFRIGDAVADAWAPYQAHATAKALGMDWQINGDAATATDRTMFVQVLSNLFSNAVAYSTSGGTLSCCLETDPHQTQLKISNPTDQITAEDLPSIFDPFWRKDASRTDSTRCGLGLSIVASYARILSLNLQTTLVDGRFSVVLTFPSLGDKSCPSAHGEPEATASLPASFAGAIPS